MVVFKQIKKSNMNKSNSICIVFFLLSFYLQAQQDPGYTQYMYNLSVVNPAYSGSKDFLSLGVLVRKQWIGISGAPRTLTAFAHSPVGKNVGLGVSLISDKVGPVNETNLYTDFSYTVKTSEDSKLAFGLKSGFTFHDIGFLSLTQVDPSDPLFIENINNNYFNMGVGIFFYTKRHYLGISIPNILKTKHFKKNNGIVTNVSEDMHTFITGGIVIEMNEKIKFKPSFLSKFAFQTPLSVDLSANFLYQDNVEFGVSYRLGDSFNGLVNFNITEGVKIGYAYDHTISNLSQFNSGTHEILLLFDFSFTNKEFISPRFF